MYPVFTVVIESQVFEIRYECVAQIFCGYGMLWNRTKQTLRKEKNNRAKTWFSKKKILDFWGEDVLTMTMESTEIVVHCKMMPDAIKFNCKINRRFNLHRVYNKYSPIELFSLRTLLWPNFFYRLQILKSKYLKL